MRDPKLTEEESGGTTKLMEEQSVRTPKLTEEGVRSPKLTREESVRVAALKKESALRRRAEQALLRAAGKDNLTVLHGAILDAVALGVDARHVTEAQRALGALERAVQARAQATRELAAATRQGTADELEAALARAEGGWRWQPEGRKEAAEPAKG